MEVLPPSGTSCVRQRLIIYRSHWCISRRPDVFIKRFFFALFNYLFLSVMHFTSHGIILPPISMQSWVYYMPLAASSGAAVSGETNMKDILGVWGCSGCLWRSALSCWDVAYPSLCNLTCEQREWPGRGPCPPGPDDWLRNAPAHPCHFHTAPPEWLWHFWNHLQIYMVFNGTYVCSKVFCSSAKVLSTLYFSHMFFLTVQKRNNALCFPVV